MRVFFSIIPVLFWVCVSISKGQAQNSAPRLQAFEDDFTIQSAPLEFLPSWSGNEIRGTSSRIFQLDGEGVAASRALAVQPISSFDAELTVRLDLTDLNGGEVRFFAKSLKNGSGNRPVEVFYSWGEHLEFLEFERLGTEDEFPNEDLPFREYQLEIPSKLFGKEVFLRIDVRYGAGIGTAARWVLDDFAYGFFVEDTIAPELLSARGYDFNQIEIQFSEALDPVFSQFLISYSLDGLEPIATALKADSLVTLTFSQPLEERREYELQATQIADLAGNFLKDTTLRVTFFDPTTIPRKGLVINEIMPAPKADLDLPNSEYVELMHTGDKSYRTHEMIWRAGDREALLPDVWIEPSEIILLVPENQINSWRDYGRVIPIANWPILLNSGATLSLSNDDGLIDQISYQTNSWGDSDLANNGFSLEVVNPFLICDQSDAWLPSLASLRGTPGIPNSVLDLTPDTAGPKLLGYRFIDSTSLEFNFDEGISSDISALNLTIEGVENPDSISVDGTDIRYFYDLAFEVDRVYRVTELAAFDCSGNVFQGEFPYEIILPKIAEKRDLKINEVLFNPITGDPKFVELANVSSSFVEIGNWFLANRDELGEADDLEQIAPSGLVIPPNAFVALTTDTVKLKSRYPNSVNGFFYQLDRLPSYPIGGGTVILLDSEEHEIEFFEYNEELHHPLLRDPKGVSLERVTLLQSANDIQNWQSASSSQDFATPGRENSQILPDELGVDVINIDPKVFDPEGSNGQTFTTISYALDQTGWIGSFRVYDLGGRLIQSLAENAILGTNGIFIWTGTDSQGKRAKVGYYVLLVELFDPSGEVVVFKKTIVIAERL